MRWVHFGAGYTGGAWLSSARVVRCWVKSRNERNPCPIVASGNAGDLQETAGVNRRKVGMTSSHHGPYVQGSTCYNGWYKGLRNREVEQIP